jgi:hypothetical protein
VLSNCAQSVDAPLAQPTLAEATESAVPAAGGNTVPLRQ